MLLFRMQTLKYSDKHSHCFVDGVKFDTVVANMIQQSGNVARALLHLETFVIALSMITLLSPLLHL